MQRRFALMACLVFSGLAALVYQVVWTRLLGFAFGTTTESIGTVLAVFFGGMALGNLLAARSLTRLERPLRVYALLELAIGAFALASWPLLEALPAIYGWLGADHGPGTMMAIRLGAAALILLPPTVAMGATLPVVARGLVADDATMGRWSALLYAANTLGAVLGAYTCGFWLIPGLGLTRTVLVAGVVNLAVAGAVWAVAGSLRAPARESRPEAAATEGAGRGWFLVFFGVSGFVAIGYEIVWSKIFSIVMEGTLYGFATVLSAYLFGIGVGSALAAPRVDRVRDLPRAFGLLHAAIAAAVAAGAVVVPFLPHALAWLREATGGEAVHVLFLLVAPLVVLPTALFGAAFPILIRIYSQRADRVGEGMGIATAVNTAGSIAGSLLVGFWWIPALGVDASLYVLLMLDLAVAVWVLLGFQAARGRARLPATAAGGLILALVAFSYNGVRVEQAVVGRWLQASSFDDYRSALERTVRNTELVVEGRSSIVTVHRSGNGRGLRTNGLPEAGHTHSVPYSSLETRLLGVLPYLLAETPRRGLVIGFGGGTTVEALARTSLEEIAVVELEQRVVQAASALYRGRPTPLDDPRVEVRINDGRNELLLEPHRESRWDVIASQPSHPWLSGAANLFTEEYFALAREALAPGGVFALWVNGFRTDADSVLAILTSFERIFPGGLVVAGGGPMPRESLILLGGLEPMVWRADRVAERLREPELARSLELHGAADPAVLLARGEGPVASFAAIAPELANTDDNAFVETRVPRRLSWENLDFAEIESRLAPDAPVLVPTDERPDVEAVARALLELSPRQRPWPFRRKLERLVDRHGERLDPVVAAVLRAEAALRDEDDAERTLASLRELVRVHPDRPEPWRLLGRYHALERRAYAEAGTAFAQAWERSGAASDAYDAGRAWHHVDAARAWPWLDRVPAEVRGDFPRFAFYDAQRSLAADAGRDELRDRWDALLAWRDTRAGRSFPGVDATLAELAEALGDRVRARAHRDADARTRHARASAARRRAEQALNRGELEAAAEALGAAGRDAPGHPGALELAVRLAVARRDPSALEQAFAALRHWAPGIDDAVALENRLRDQAGLPLLPERPPEELIATAPPASAR